MSWRINTRAEAQDSRHFHSGWNADDTPWKPSDGYEEPANGWGAFVFYVLAGLGVACAVAWAIKEILK
jgi:hypothetical protein